MRGERDAGWKARAAEPSPESPAPRAANPAALDWHHELARKALHLTTTSVPLAYAAGLPRRWVIALLVAACGVALAVEWGRATHAATRAAFDRVTGRLLRVHEHERWAGATWLLLAFLGSVVIFPRAVAIVSMWAVAVGDAAAALVGRALGRHHLFGASKTIEGSLACFTATLAGAVFVARLPVSEGLIAATAASLAEWPGRPLDDNIRIAAATGCGILLWGLAFS